MKLYAFKPNSIGPDSFFVMAESKSAAMRAIDEFIAADKARSEEHHTPFLDTTGWRRPVRRFGFDERYELTVADAGAVISNGNT